jgi:hypothetical protein
MLDGMPFPVGKGKCGKESSEAVFVGSGSRVIVLSTTTGTGALSPLDSRGGTGLGCGVWDASHAVMVTVLAVRLWTPAVAKFDKSKAIKAAKNKVRISSRNPNSQMKEYRRAGKVSYEPEN